MRFSSPVTLALLAISFSQALPAPLKWSTPDSPSPLPLSTTSPSEASELLLDLLAQFAQAKTKEILGARSTERAVCKMCNIAVRREWGSLSLQERKSYTDAVLCLQAKTAETPLSLIPGARSRFDDWVGTHINQTLTIHYTGAFLAWHRYFTWQYEQALRNECGYQGYQPYWDWAKTAITGLENSPIWDGSDYSMSGNGEPIPNQKTIIIGGNGLPEILVPPGSGGGCVQRGPFKDMKVNLGPVALTVPGNITESNGNGLSYNPRCLKRDLTNYINKRWGNAKAIISLILQNQDINSFQMTMQGVPGSGQIGVHGGGHYTMGGDPGRDIFVSPGDPAFYLHHAMIDRVWWIWQQLDPETRTGAEGIAGTGTFLNTPPSRNTTLDTVVDLGYAGGPPQTMRDLMSTIDGPMCYIYL